MIPAPGAAQAVMAVLAHDPVALSRAFQHQPFAASVGVAAALESLRVRGCRAHVCTWLQACQLISVGVDCGCGLLIHLDVLAPFTSKHEPPQADKGVNGRTANRETGSDG
jgi:hypothetical protein